MAEYGPWRWRRRWLEGLVSVLLLLCPTACTGEDSPAYNCSHSYLLSPSPAPHLGTCCQGSCVTSTPLLQPSSGGGDTCQSVLDVLHTHAGDVISGGDCLELVFLPGTYQLSSLTAVTVGYSVVMSAQEGGVVFTCAASLEPSCVCGEGEKVGAGGIVKDTAGRVTPMVTFEGGRQDNVFVVLEGIEIENCSRHLEFKSLRSLRVQDCKFV